MNNKDYIKKREWTLILQEVLTISILTVMISINQSSMIVCLNRLIISGSLSC